MRDHARISLEMWSDPDFQALAPGEQRLYLLILTQPRLSFAGVLDWFPKRIAPLARDCTVRRIEREAAALEAARFIVIDHDTSELLVRSFVRHDGLLKQPNVAKAMVKDWQAIHSAQLRQVVVDELRRAYTEDRDLKGWPAVMEVLPVPLVELPQLKRGAVA